MSEALSRTNTTGASFAEVLVDAVRSVLPADRTVYPLHEPSFDATDQEAVRACLESGWVSSAGPDIDRFEAMLAEMTGASHVVATANGTAALHLAYLVAGVARGDEVIVPALTFVATANAIAYCGGVTHFADSDEATLGLDAGKLAAHLARVAERRGADVWNRETERRIAAVVVTHVFGHAADLDGLTALCREWGLPLIEDTAEALGSHHQGRHVGATGLCGALSFNGNKLITTGGGGALLTSDADLAQRVRHLSTTAKRSHAWRFDHDAVAYNYRLPNLNAALGTSQLARLPALLEQKRVLAERYIAGLSGLEGLRVVREPTGCRSNYWLNAVLLDRERAAERDDLLEALHAAGFLARPAWTLLSDLPMYADAPHMDLSTATSLEQRLICLPSSPDLA